MKDKSYVRLTYIKLTNFKNIKSGEISLDNIPEYNANLIGVYGQNGSGKTALIEAIDLLSYLLKGRRIPEHFADFINIQNAEAELEFHFECAFESERYQAQYSAILKAVRIESESNIADEENTRRRPVVCNEKLKFAYQNDAGVKNSLQTMINTDSDSVFIPETKFALLVGKGREVNKNLLVAKEIASRESRSFLFSPELLGTIRKNTEIHDSGDFRINYRLLERLVLYGNTELFVINTSHSGLISLNLLPLSFRFETENEGFIGDVAIMIAGATVIPKKVFKDVSMIIGSMNIVLQQIVPGLTIKVRDYGEQSLQNGASGERIELMSVRGGNELPLQYESEGIKKILSILQLLIVVYNKKSITVAVDELDSGIFEYLLGELLKIISEQGKGQLIFTSHNLRPLETLDKKCIVFTTTNPENRYVRMQQVKTNNNLRDFYYRDISLGTQAESLYDFTDNARIGKAFRKAGSV